MKKGASHVDWSISMGIFIIYVLSLIIFLRPGLEESIDRTILLEILEDGFDGYANYEIIRTPVFVTKSGSSGIYQLMIDFTGLGGFPLIGSPEEYTLTDNNNERLPFSLSLGATDIMRFNATLLGSGTGQNIFWLAHQENAVFQNIDPDQQPENTIQVNLTGPLAYAVGISETVKGINESRLADLDSESNLRTALNYPVENGFLINIIDSDNFNYNQVDIIYTYQTVDNDNNETVFVKEVKGKILNDDGSSKNIIINFRVW